ncbi:hypothetical protein PAXINDRAFT_66454 [Paxillus involutus ATCC 200175]|nr:hypothetical protein PAXINDRAFT_66454 [Paxillus involutus ATCC 200175]
MSSVLTVAVLGAVVMTASPTLFARQSIIALTTVQIDYFTPYTYYASAGHCIPSQILAWDCGTSCPENPDVEPVASGGDGAFVQYWFVGYDSNLDTVIVSHQGTDPSKIVPLVTDVDMFLTNLDSALFPGISSSIKVHNGFGDAQASSATDVLAAVKTATSKYITTSVTMVGHSLGAAITLLDSVHLPLWLPAGTTFKTIVYGLPRVENKAFADLRL